MGRKYDIAERIASANQKSTIVIDSEHEYIVNNGKSVVIMAQALYEDIDGKDTAQSIAAMDKIIEMVLGADAAQYIAALDLTLPAYTELVKAVMAAFTDSDLEEIDERTKEAEEGEKK